MAFKYSIKSVKVLLITNVQSGCKKMPDASKRPIKLIGRLQNII